MKKAAIVACSNARQSKYRQETEDLTAFLESIGIQTELSDCIYSDDGVFSGTPWERAAQLMKMYRDPLFSRSPGENTSPRITRRRSGTDGNISGEAQADRTVRAYAAQCRCETKILLIINSYAARNKIPAIVNAMPLRRLGTR